ncbi:MAG: hypothetical protein QXK98_07660 [Candidatus Bathyarchaeia archaeon]
MRPKNPKPQFKIRLDPIIWKTFKLKCKSEGLRPNSVVERLILLYLEKPFVIKFLEGE